MMYQNDSVYLRTESGREEIHNKSHGLTQSERLVLILIDGITSVDGLKAKLKGLTEDRFDRALATLIERQFVTEILLRFDGAEPEEVADEVAKIFLHQDDLDPVTIISYDPEEEFGQPGTNALSNGNGFGTALKIDLKEWVNRSDVLVEGPDAYSDGQLLARGKTVRLDRVEREPDLLLDFPSPSIDTQTRQSHSLSRDAETSVQAPPGKESTSRKVVSGKTINQWRCWTVALTLGLLWLLYLRFR